GALDLAVDLPPPTKPPLRPQRSPHEAMEPRHHLHPALLLTPRLHERIQSTDAPPDLVELERVDLPERTRKPRSQVDHPRTHPRRVLAPPVVLDTHRQHLGVLVPQLPRHLPRDTHLTHR